MPELPEVETTIRYLRPYLVDKVIADLTVSEKGASHFNSGVDEMRGRLVGSSLQELSRVGKWMLFDFGAAKIVGHLRMSGRYKVEDSVLDHPHNRFQIHIQDGPVLNYIDQRRFGTFHLVEDFESHPALQKLGPDVLGVEFTVDYLRERLASVTKPIYSALLDQKIVAGLGNIYVNEVLHASHIHPRTPAKEVTEEQLGEIVKHTREILSLALSMKGTTLIDNLYQDPGGDTGEFAKMLKVYGKKHAPDVEVIKIGGRSVFFSTSLRV